MLVLGALPEGVELVSVAIGYSTDDDIPGGSFSVEVRTNETRRFSGPALPDEWSATIAARSRQELGASAKSLRFDFRHEPYKDTDRRVNFLTIAQLLRRIP